MDVRCKRTMAPARHVGANRPFNSALDYARNIYAAGEIMAGNILRKGYIAGVGMTIGTVFGRIAGEEAARHAAR